MIPVARLNHAVLFVRDVEASVAFYRDALDFRAVHQLPGAAFLQAAASNNDHDLGLFGIGSGAGPKRGGIGLYHLAWQVDTIDELAAARDALRAAGAYTGESSHGATKSIYGADPDGNEFEIMWRVPREAWGEYEQRGAVMPLDMEAEVRRYGAT